VLYYRHKGKHQYIGKPKAKDPKLNWASRKSKDTKQKETNVMANPKDDPPGRRKFQHKSFPHKGNEKKENVQVIADI
jgi:hypothetical protein